MMRLALAAFLALAAAANAADLNPPQLDAKAGEGCWVRFFEDREFARPLGRLTGGMYVYSIANPGMIGGLSEREFFKEAGSAVVGPEARLIAYAEPGFEKEILALEPGRQVPDLRAIGFPKEVASLKIVCERR